MNWIERLYEIKNKDLYSQNGEGLILEYIFHQFNYRNNMGFVDIGGGDGFYLSNTRHLANLGWVGTVLDRENGIEINAHNVLDWLDDGNVKCDLLSIDIDGSDYWILKSIFESDHQPSVIVAEFNSMYTDSRTIVYNPRHVWDGDSYYGFTFEAGVKLAEKHGYKVIFQTGDMNMFMVRADLIEGLNVPPVTYKQNDFFKLSDRSDWVLI